MKKSKRPISVTIIAWLLTIAGCMSLLVIPLTLIMSESREAIVQQGISITRYIISGFVGIIICFFAGIGMLKGHNWARLLYLLVTPIAAIINITIGLSSGVDPNGKMIFGIVGYIVVLIFLTRPKVVTYFKDIMEEEKIEGGR